MLEHVPDQFKTKEMCEKAMGERCWVLRFVPDHFVTQEMCNRAMQRHPWDL